MVLDPDFSGAILKTNANDGSPAPNNPFKSDNSNDPINWYQAYGIKKRLFGLGIDPVAGALWDTENGEQTFDEINLVSPGFNSGWKLTIGPISESGISQDEFGEFSRFKLQGSYIEFQGFYWHH